MSRRIPAIPTTYNGRIYRSRLESEWARFFDERGIRFAYEEESFDLGGVRYLPDFWLPDVRTVVEVKGLLDDASFEKVHRLSLALWDQGDPGGDTTAPLLVLGYSPVPTVQVVVAGLLDDAHCSTCDRCGRTYFATNNGSWRCRYDGCDGSHS